MPVEQPTAPGMWPSSLIIGTPPPVVQKRTLLVWPIPKAPPSGYTFCVYADVGIR